MVERNEWFYDFGMDTLLLVLTVKVDFLSSQNLFAATVVTKEVNHANTVINI